MSQTKIDGKTKYNKYLIELNQISLIVTLSLYRTRTVTLFTIFIEVLNHLKKIGEGLV